MRAHLVQLDLAWEDKPENFRRVERILRDTSVKPGDLVVLPEMFDSGFSFHTAITSDGVYHDRHTNAPTPAGMSAEPAVAGALGTDGLTLRTLRGWAREMQCTIHGARTLVAPDGKGRNMATIIGPDGTVLAEYAKVHPFSYGKESEFFLGGTGITTYTWTLDRSGPVKVCPAVCYDLRFPELFRLGLRAGAEMFVIGANWPRARAAHWRALLVARAIENQAIVLGVNRVGKDPSLEYAGGSIAVGPRGELLGELGEAEGVLTVPIDIHVLRAWRETFPAWCDAKLLGRQ